MRRVLRYIDQHLAPAGRQVGASIVELLVSMAIAMIVLAGVVTAITVASKQSRDNEIISRAHEVARAVLDYMVFDLRLMGAGMPLGQNLFPIGPYTPAGTATIPPLINWGDSTYPLGDAPWPILPGSDATHIYLRLNERGIETVLSADFDPATSSVIRVLNLNDFVVGDIVYVYDRRKDGNAGLRAQIVSRSPGTNSSSGLTPGTITLSSTRNVSATGGTPYVFTAGSSVNRVSTVSYVSPSSGGGIELSISDYDATLRRLYPGTSFTLTYWNRLGAQVTMPASATTSNDLLTLVPTVVDLASIVVQVTAVGDSPLSDGSIYRAVAGQEVGLRNLILDHY